MRVVMNLSEVNGNKTGIGHHTMETLKALRATGKVKITTYPNPNLRKLHVKLGGGPKLASLPSAPPEPGSSTTGASVATPVEKVEVRRPFLLRALRAPLRHAWGLVNEVHTRAMFDYRLFDLYHEPNFVPLPGFLPTVVNVYDLSPVLSTHWHPEKRVKWFEKYFTPNVHKFDHILAISEFSRDEIMRTFGFTADRVTRTYCGVREHLRPLPADETAATLRQLGLPPTYLLHVGTIEPRKNLDMLLRAYCSLPDDLRQLCPLVIVGGWGWKMEDTARFYEDVARHKNVIRPGYLPDETLPAVYNGARALLFPTFYEGFGLPAAEMLACGGAVISSTAGAVAEVLGNCGHQIDPRDADAWRDAMARVITDDDWRNQLRQGGTEQASRFTWQGCAKDTIKAYEKTLAATATKRKSMRTM